MPVNATAEYFKAEEKFHSAKNKEEKIAALEEMIRTLPKHKGTEHVLAHLRGKMAKLKKESEKKGAKRAGISKEGDAQVCIIGLTNSGKSTLLSRLTSAKPRISSHPYTTVEPEIGMMDYKGIKIQLVEIPSTFEPRFLSIARTADALVVITRNDKERKQLEHLLQDNFIRTKRVVVSSFEGLKEQIWDSLGLIIAYTKDNKKTSPMALKRGSKVRDFAERIHKDFVKNFRFARLRRGARIHQVGLDYELKDGDIVEVYTD